MDSPNISRSKEVLKSIAGRLRSAREAKGLNLEQAHIKTRIHLNILKALEEGAIDEVISVPYAKGFLKKYAEFLGLKGDEILNEYLAIHGESRTPAPLKGSVGTKDASSDTLSRAFSYAILSVIVVILIFATSAYFKNRKPKPRQQKAGAVVVKKAAPIKRPSPPVKKTPPQGAVKDLASPAVTIPKNEPIIVTLKIKRKVMVQAAKDGNIMFRNVLREGIQETVKARERVNLAITNMEALDITVNGKPLSIQRKGGINDLEITRNGVKIK